MTPAMGSLPSIELSFSSSPLVPVLLLLAAAGAAYLCYRVTLPPVSRTMRLLLAGLRGAALALVLLLLVEPVLRAVAVVRRSAVVAVLADASESMAITDARGSRAATLRALLANVIPGAVPPGTDMALYTFGSSVRGPLAELPDSLRDEVTDIAGALMTLEREKDRRNIGAAIILSDGAVTRGENPALSADAAGIPLFTVGIGDTAEQRDVLVEGVVANDVVYAGAEAPVDVVIKSSGYGGAKAEVSLEEGTRLLDRTTVTLPPGTADVPARLAYTPAGEGRRRYTVRIARLPGELTGANNSRSFTATVLKSTTRVLLLAAGPGEDLSAVRSTLGEDPNVTLRVLTQKFGGGYYEGALDVREADSADCLLTIGMPDGRTSPQEVALVRSLITGRRTPLFFIGGRDVDLPRALEMFPSLPVTPGSALPGEMEVEFVPDPSRMDHPLLALGAPGERDAWKDLPPVFADRTSWRLREGSVMLGSPALKSVVLPQPFMALRDVGGVRSLCLTGYGLWRWRLMAQGSEETAPVFASLLSSAIRWLTGPEGERRVRVAPEREQFAGGEPVAFTGQVYDESARPVEDAQVTVRIGGAGQHPETELHGLGNGRYEGALEGLPPGDYTYEATAAGGGHVLGNDSGSFTVGGLNLEFIDTRMHPDVLRAIAYRSGGAYVDAADAGALKGMIASLPSLRAREDAHADTLELHRTAYILALIIVLFAAEWILRKRSGML